MTDYLEIDPATAEKRQIYRMLVGSVVPRPIGWASTVNQAGVTNLAPFSFFTVVCVVPPMISLTIARNPDGSEKHTLKNIRESGEFCFNVVTQPVWKEMVDSANGFPEGDSEFTETGLTPIRPCFVEFPQDPAAWTVDDAYLFGPDLLVAPVLEAGARQWPVYLPQGAAWQDAWTGEEYEGGQTVTVPAPLERIPLFLRDGARLPVR